jgi:hypothetical protein
VGVKRPQACTAPAPVTSARGEAAQAKQAEREVEQRNAPVNDREHAFNSKMNE